MLKTAIKSGSLFESILEQTTRCFSCKMRSCNHAPNTLEIEVAASTSGNVSFFAISIYELLGLHKQFVIVRDLERETKIFC